VFTEPEISHDTVFINANQKSPNLFFALSLKTGQLYYSSVPGNSNTLGALTYSEGRIFSVYNTTLIAVNTKTGAVIWNKFPSAGLGFSAKTFVKVSTVYAATTSGIPGLQFKLYALDVVTGVTKWEFLYDGEFYGTCYPDGNNLYFTTATGIYCIDAITGALVWKRNNDNNFRAGGQLVIVNNRIIFSGPRYYGVYCIDKSNGTTLWNYKNGNYLQSTVSYGNGMVYFNEIETSYPFTNNLLTALNVQTGDPAWSRSSNYMFTLFAGNRIYSRSNMRSDIEVTKAADGVQIFRMMNPANYYTDNLTRFSLIIDEQYYFFPTF
jgi:outer membrane protein assembly factor BamB